MFFIQQTSNHDCGFTSLKVLLANIHHDSNYLFLINPFKEDEDVSFLSLIKEAEKYRVNLTALRAENPEGLASYKDLPFIARIKVNNSYHAVYVYKISKKHVYYFDPSLGKKKIFVNEFIEIWSKELLSIKSYEKYPSPVKKPMLMKIRESLIALGISLISIVSSVLAIYFINKDSYIYLPIIFFSLMLIAELTLKAYNINILKKIDTRLEELVGEVKRKDYYNFYVNYEAYKKYLVLNNLTIFSNFASFILISLIFIINDKSNVIYIGINLLLAFSYILLVKPLLDKDEASIIEEESHIKLAKDKLTAFAYMSNARSISYKYVNKDYAYKIVVIALEVLLTFIMMIYFKLVSVTYIILYSGLQLYLYNSVTHLLNANSDLSKQDNLLNKLLNSIENK